MKEIFLSLLSDYVPRVFSFKIPIVLFSSHRTLNISNKYPDIKPLTIQKLPLETEQNRMIFM